VGKPDGGVSQSSGAGRGDEGQNWHRVLVPLAAEVPAKAETVLPPEEPKPANPICESPRAATAIELTAALRNRAVKAKTEAAKDKEEKLKAKASKPTKANTTKAKDKGKTNKRATKAT